MSQEAAARRRQKYTSRACQPCRRRKIKCDGGKPSCLSCLQLHDECTYSEGRDGRRAAGRDYVSGLEERIRVLEALLKEHQQDVPSIGDGIDQSEEEDEIGSLGLDRLKFDAELHEFHQYGPTSAFQHLSEADPSRAGSFSPTSPSARRTSMSMDSSSQFDWGRHLPLGIRDEWDKALHDDLIRFCLASFSFYNIVDERGFLTDMQECLSRPIGTSVNRTSSYSPMLHNTILLCGTDFSDDPRARDPTVIERLIQQSRDELYNEAERPSLPAVQGAILLGNYLTSANQHGLGYMYTGVAIRMTHSLGLNVDCSVHVRRGLLSQHDQRARERTLWICYVYDKLWSSYIGHDPSLSIESLQISFPAIDKQLDDRALYSEGANLTIASMVSTTFHWTCRLAALEERIMLAVYGAKVALYSAAVLDKVSSASVELDQWWDTLPAALRILPQSTSARPPHVITLNAYFHCVVILLYRPYYLRRASDADVPVNETAVRRCNAAASRINACFEAYDNLWQLRRGPIALVQFGFVACTTHLLALVHAEAGSSKTACDAARTAAEASIGHLDRLGPPYKTSVQYTEILRRLMSEWSSATTCVMTEVVPEEQESLVPPFPDFAQYNFGLTPTEDMFMETFAPYQGLFPELMR